MIAITPNTSIPSQYYWKILPLCEAVTSRDPETFSTSTQMMNGRVFWIAALIELCSQTSINFEINLSRINCVQVPVFNFVYRPIISLGKAHFHATWNAALRVQPWNIFAHILHLERGMLNQFQLRNPL
jgi:hypothetical protein